MNVLSVMSGPRWGRYITQINLIITFDIYKMNLDVKQLLFGWLDNADQSDIVDLHIHEYGNDEESWMT